MPVRDALLAQVLTPIAGDRPAGTYVRDDPVYHRIKEARREDDDLPAGEWDAPRKLADLPLVITLAGETLAARSKDLEVAAWLAEALLRKDGVAGLRDGLALLRGLLERFWDGLYPEIDEEDGAGLRAAPLGYVGLKLDVAVRNAPMTAAGHTFAQYVESRLMGTPEEARDDGRKARLRKEAVERGKPLPEEIDKAVEATPKAYYRELVVAVDGALAELAALEALGDERFGDDAPSYRRLRDALAEAERVARPLLAQKLARDPDPVDPVDPADPAAAGSAAAAPARGAAARAPVTAGGPAGGPDDAPAPGAEPAGAADAVARVVGAARHLRRAAPTDPTAYLILRALRWGELRAGAADGGAPAPRLLEAPPTPARARLKALLLDERWAELLDACEELLATPAGRAWLDLQRYAAVACAQLGAEYAGVAGALRGALGALLADFPALADATLMDDTPAANAETRAWLAAERLLAGAAGGAAGDGAGNGATSGALSGSGTANGAGNGAGNGTAPGGARFPAPAPTYLPRAAEPSALDRALAEVHAGRAERAIAGLVGSLAAQRSARDRFLRRVDVATVLVEAGLPAVAEPILDELLEEVDARKLEEWEPGDVIARPMVLLCRVIDATDGDRATRRTLYPRVCRLDPVAAMRLPAE